MDKFSLWTGIAHATLLKHHKKLKRSQACECLAAWLGHRTYASLRVHDLAVLNDGVKHAIVDALAAMKRAEAFGLPLTREQWRDVEFALKPSGISGMWLTEMQSMSSAAKLAFEDNYHPDAQVIAESVGMTDGRWGETVIARAPDNAFPEQLRFTVSGSVRAFNEEVSLAMPVLAEVVFQRAGVRLYMDGQVESVTRNGEPYAHENEFEGDDYGGSYDD
jgi:hypothetical protein